MTTVDRPLLMVAMLAAMAASPGAADAQTPSGVVWASVEATTAPTARHENGMAAVAGRLYLIGGRGDRPLERFDPTTGAWVRLAPPPLRLHHLQAVALDGRIFVVSAFTGDFPEETPISHVLIYDPATDAWLQGPEIPLERRRGASGVGAHEGRIYVVGGNRRGHMSGYVPWLDVLDPSTGDWTVLPDAPNARDHFHAAVIDGRIYAAGGRRSSHDTGEGMSLPVAAVDVFDIASGRWRTLAEPLPTLRSGTSAIVQDGALLIIGGESLDQQAAHAEVERLNVATGAWTRLPPLPVGRHGTQAVSIDGAIHIVAGSGNRGGGPELDDHQTLANVLAR
jgi:Kelch motif/Galactose oxidase, central domain